MWGTVVWCVEYKRGSLTDYKTVVRCGTSYEFVKKSLLATIGRKGWKIVNIEETCNTFIVDKRRLL